MSLRALPIAFTLDRWVDLENTNCTDSAPNDVEITKAEPLNVSHVVAVALLFLGTAVVESGWLSGATVSNPRDQTGDNNSTPFPHQDPRIGIILCFEVRDGGLKELGKIFGLC